MATSQDPQSIAEVRSSQDCHEIQSNHQNPSVTEAPVQDPGSSSIADGGDKMVSHADIEFVQNLIERCLQLYMNKGEAVKTLSNRARIEPGFTALVWQKLEEENSEFFRAYYIRLKLKKQIILFNKLLEHQCHLMKYPIPPKAPLAPTQNGIHPVYVNNFPMGYPVFQPQIPTTSQLHVDPTGCVLSSCHVVSGIPAPGSFNPIRTNMGNDVVMDNGPSEATPAAPQCSTMSPVLEMAVSSASAASSNHFPFNPSEISMGMDVSALATTFTSDVLGKGGLQLEGDGVASSRDSLESLGQLWNFSLSDLTTDLTNLGDLGALADYTGSPFLPSDSEILLDSSDQVDIVREYFADPITGPCSLSDEDT